MSGGIECMDCLLFTMALACLEKNTTGEQTSKTKCMYTLMQIPSKRSKMPNKNYKNTSKIQNTPSQIPDHQNKECSDQGEADDHIADHADVKNLDIKNKKK